MIRGRRELPFRQEMMENRHYETDASNVGNDGLSVAFLETLDHLAFQGWRSQHFQLENSTVCIGWEFHALPP